MTPEELDAVPLADLLAAAARQRPDVPYGTEAELLEAEATGWGAVAIMRDKKGRIFASMFGPYGTRVMANEARLVIQTNHALAKRKGRTDTVLIRTESKPIWKAPR